MQETEKQTTSKNIHTSTKAIVAIGIFVIISVISACIYAVCAALNQVDSSIKLLLVPHMLVMIFYILPLAIEGIIRLFKVRRLLQDSPVVNNDKFDISAENYKKVLDSCVWIYFMLTVHFVSAVGIVALSISPVDAGGNNFMAVYLLAAGMGPAELSVIFSVLSIVVLRSLRSRIAIAFDSESKLALQRLAKHAQIVTVLNIIISSIISVIAAKA